MDKFPSSFNKPPKYPSFFRYPDHEKRIEGQTEMAELMMSSGYIDRYEIYQDDEDFDASKIDYKKDSSGWLSILRGLLVSPMLIIDDYSDERRNIIKEELNQKKLTNHNLPLLDFFATNKLEASNVHNLLVALKTIITSNEILDREITIPFLRIEDEGVVYKDPDFSVEDKIKFVKDLTKIAEKVIRLFTKD